VLRAARIFLRYYAIDHVRQVYRPSVDPGRE
jgi:hypothetical protein